SGQTICMPKGYSTSGLSTLGLSPTATKLRRPDAPADCMREVASGQSYATLLTTTVAEDALAEAGLDEEIDEVAALNVVDTIHAVTSIDHPNRDENIALVNAGIAKVRESGTWFEVVHRHLVNHRVRTR
ncbi:MAG: hypothetical protein AAF360_15110, partial [Pseudomonadota bacterium]